MPVLKLSVIAEVDGVPVPGFPLQRRMSLSQGQQFDYQKAADGDAVTFTALPADDSIFSTIQALLLRADVPVAVRLNGQTDAGVTIQAGGFVVICDALITAAVGSKAKINNNSTGAATVKGYAAGS